MSLDDLLAILKTIVDLEDIRDSQLREDVIELVLKQIKKELEKN